MSTGFAAKWLLIAPLLMGCGGALDDEPPATPPPPPPPPAVEPQPAPEPYTEGAPTPPPASDAQPSPATAPAAPATPPPAVAPGGQPSAPLVYTYPTGQWVYVAGQGWVWVPSGANTAEVEGVPYAYLYTPSYGWTWYISPWGLGPYHYGVWYRHPWHPVGWHSHWVAHPHVVVRLGHGGYHRR
jgi:hypothetical protein